MFPPTYAHAGIKKNLWQWNKAGELINGRKFQGSLTSLKWILFLNEKSTDITETWKTTNKKGLYEPQHQQVREDAD